MAGPFDAVRQCQTCDQPGTSEDNHSNELNPLPLQNGRKAMLLHHSSYFETLSGVVCHQDGQESVWEHAKDSRQQITKQQCPWL